MPTRESQNPDNPATAAHAVVFVHADQAAAADPRWVERLAGRGMALFSHRALDSCHQTRHSYPQLGHLLNELSEQAPGLPVLLLRAGLEPTEGLLEEILTDARSAEGAAAFTALSNALPGLNPFAGARGETPRDNAALAATVRQFGPGHQHPCFEWPGHLVALSPGAVVALSGPDVTPASALSRLQAGGGRLVVNDRHFVHDPARPLFNQRPLDPHEAPRPPSWGMLNARLQAWLDSDCPELPVPDESKPVTLHVTHDWGGGVAAWVSSYIAADDQSQHLQLRAEGPQSGQGFGQRLALYAGDQLACPLASWWLQPPIQSVAAARDDYRQVLAEVVTRYGVGSIVVSSLVGHSLDALRSGLPTIQVLHDHFPAWPFLSVHPDRFRQGDGGVDFESAMADPEVPREFSDHDAAAWRDISHQYLAAVSEHGVRLVAPSHSAADLHRSLDPDTADLDIEVIPHGVPPLPGAAPVKARGRSDRRLRLLIPGRIQPGKGQQLLRQALPELRQYAKVYLLGAGQCGEAFFGLPDVNVVIEYRREDLASLVRQIGPDLAALLSVVPETFSYTLSEMQQLGVPVIATRVGAFPARIEDGQTGWLIEPQATALVDLVRRLHGDRELLAATRKQLGPVSADTPADMVQAYRALLSAAPPAPEMPQPDPGLEQAQAASLAYLGMLEHAGRLALEDRVGELGKEVAQRTEWALDRDQALRQEQETRRRWVAQLEAEIAAQQQALHEVRSELAETRHNLEENQRQLDRTQQLLDQVLSSLSWRLTRPLRVLRRMARNFMVSGAWNPLRWPLFIAGLARNLTTVGWRGTLMRMQYAGPQAEPEAVPVEHLEAIGDPDPPNSLPVSAQPVASIVIPVYNNWAYTAACLRSIAEAGNFVPFEVIVVDDQSSDETPARLASIEGLKVLTNERNCGFIDSCNRGASEARGEYLVMLNNDTQVLDGWLDQLRETFGRHPDAGLVGARLLYPDGRLQECGGIVFNDASGWNYGRNDQPERPEYKHLREADYCSGACFMIETALFRALGGFDERYRPAYYEDTDLAFRVRAAGRKVLVQPASTVIHHEGVTCGTDTDSGAKRYQLVNQEKFRERWQDELRTYPPRIDDPTNPAAIRAARDHHLAGRVLVIDATTPEPDQDSGSLRLTNLMRCFRELGFGVTFMPENHANAGRYTRDLRALGIEVVHQPWVESNHEFFRQRGAQFDCVLISRHYVAAHFAPLVNKYCARAALIFDTVDLHYLREERLAELENSLPLRRVAERTRRSELAVIAQSDAVVVVSPAEAEVLAADAPDALVHVITNIHEVPGRRVDFGARSDLFFVGGYQHPPNVDAAQWFVSRIWPLIHAQLPETRFHLIGSKAPDSVRALKGDGVLFHGYVEDLEHYLDRCRLAVAPLRYGAGVKGKVNMSMSYGQPVVATSAAIEGTHAEHGRDILVADSEQAFADEVVRLYQDQELWTRISDAAVANVERHFSLSAGRDSLEQLLERLQG